MKTVPLHGRIATGRVALVDDADYDLVTQYHWNVVQSYSQKMYATTSVHAADGRRTSLRMHKLITGWAETDHEDNDGLNNQRYNLRRATRSQNNANRRKSSSPSSSRYKGVGWHGRARKWAARIKVDGRNRHLGLFVSEDDAARAYDLAAAEAFGEFALVNFPQGMREHA